ncbi:MAG: pilus assembly protein PilP [Pseudomonadales bacterium]
MNRRTVNLTVGLSSNPLGLLNLRFVLCIILFMAGCSSGDQNADIRAFMKEVENKPRGQIAPLPEFEPYRPFAYGAANLRSPFEAPVVRPTISESKKKNIGVKPPRNHVKQYLERFSIASLSMVGTLQQQNETWALIRDDSAGVHRVQVGDFIGTQWGQIESINDARIDIIEIVSDGASGWLRRPRTIEIKGLN